jgi:hypothetical protein
MRLYWIIVLVLVVAVGLLGWSHLASAAGERPAGGTGAEIAPEPNPIVSVVVGDSETNYEQDPFDQTRLKRSSTRVKSLLIVRADGRVETKQVP